MSTADLIERYRAATTDYRAACDAENGPDGWRAATWRRTDEMLTARDAAAVDLADAISEVTA